ncbi:Fic family protein [Patescibacteria group bacterium]|nr:Fic family protein [Patescibacteria group bacterium]MBU1015662.1 Fic family protein [Patescibacteria group bacterium]MBU1684763.1 Fic family protein [Patescibacteria group bacterium]MBU1938197.1 Fic family protein [Patescibacteria group bacterium]
MAEPSRYNVGGDQAPSEILKNKLRIKDQQALEDTESVLFSDTYEYFLAKLNEGKLEFNIALIFDVHKYFLGPLYSWAGKVRSVQISKDGVLFCKAAHIESALKEFENLLRKGLPGKSDSKSAVAEKLAIIHCEFNAIHPFREGNGRTIRLFLDLVALNCDYSLIDFGKTSKKTYIEACIAGMNQDYSKMKSIIYKGLRKK